MRVPCSPRVCTGGHAGFGAADIAVAGSAAADFAAADDDGATHIVTKNKSANIALMRIIPDNSKSNTNHAKAEVMAPPTRASDLIIPPEVSLGICACVAAFNAAAVLSERRQACRPLRCSRELRLLWL